MFDWEGFENRKFCVCFNSDADKRKFLKECEKKGLKIPEPIEKYLLNTSYSYSEWEPKTVLYNSAIENIVIYNPNLIDCSIAVNFAEEYGRMCKSQIMCDKTCPLFVDNGQDCPLTMKDNPQKAVEIVQKWSDEHPREKVVTLQDKFLELFPDADLDDKGAIMVNPCSIFRDITHSEFCKFSCKECHAKFWSQPYKENTNED